MTRYYASLAHHSIGRSTIHDVGESLTGAKINASRLLGDGFDGHWIVIYDRRMKGLSVARKRIGTAGWETAPWAGM